MESELAGMRILVVEDRAPVAMALCDRLTDRGATIVGPAARLAEATELAATREFDVALLDVDLGGVYTYDLARTLRARGLRVVLMTGYDARSLPEDLRDIPLFDKLDSVSALSGALQRLG